MKYLAVLALLFAIASAMNHQFEVDLVNGLTRSFAHGFETGLYATDVEVSEGCGGEWSLDVLDEIFNAMEKLDTETYTSLMVIFKNSVYYATQSYYFCGWYDVF